MATSPKGAGARARAQQGLPLSEGVTDLELMSALDGVVEWACRIVGARRAFLRRDGADPAAPDIQIFHACTPDSEPSAVSPQQAAFLGSFTDPRRPVRVPDLTTHPGSGGWGGQAVTSLLSVPIRVRGEVYGHLFLTDKAGGGAFTDTDEESAIALADAARRAVENAEAYEERRLQRSLECASEMTRLLLGEVDLGEAMHLVTKHVREISGAIYSAIALLDPADPDMVVYASVDGLGLEGDVGTRLPRRGLTASVIESNQAIVLGDVSHDERYDPPAEWREPLSALGSAMFTPLAAPNAPLGVLIVGWGRGTAHDRMAASGAPQVQSFADQAALALRRVQAQDERTRHERWLEATSEMAGLLLGEVDRDEAMCLVIKQIRALTGADVGGITLVDPANPDQLYLAAVDGIDRAHHPDVPIARTGLLSQVIASGRRVATRNLTLEPDFDPSDGWGDALAGMRMAMGIPLRSGGEVLGVLFAAWRRGSPHEPTAAREADHMQTFADLAALALQRVRAQVDHEHLLILEDRNRIARDVHDLVIQRLFAVGLRLKTTGGLSTEPKVRQRLNKTIGELDETNRQIRAAIFGDDPDEADRPGSRSRTPGR